MKLGNSRIGENLVGCGCQLVSVVLLGVEHCAIISIMIIGTWMAEKKLTESQLFEGLAVRLGEDEIDEDNFEAKPYDINEEVFPIKVF